MNCAVSMCEGYRSGIPQDLYARVLNILMLTNRETGLTLSKSEP